MFDRCHHSKTVVTPVKHERDIQQINIGLNDYEKMEKVEKD